MNTKIGVVNRREFLELRVVSTSIRNHQDERDGPVPADKRIFFNSNTDLGLK